MSADLFASAAQSVRGQTAPLAERMRPRSLDEYAGQQELIGPGRLLRRIFEDEQRARAAGAATLRPLPSVILWGPPGTGKTTLACLLARAANAQFETFSAVSSGVKDAREVIQKARERLNFEQRRTLLFVDEIHRFNKAQQDAFLPAVEDGTLALLGATTENPSFELNNALLSRCRVFVLKPLAPADLGLLIDRALSDPARGLGALNGAGVRLEPDAREELIRLSGGDARSALNGLELAAYAAPEPPPGPDGRSGPRTIDAALIREALQRSAIAYDKSGEEHFNLISAFQKSIRHSDPDAALYYLARMIAGGEDPLFIARRLVRTASEDIGLADPQAVVQALAAKQSVEFIGYPECDSALAQATVYLAVAPKSWEVYQAINAAKAEVERSGALPVPLHYRNAPTELMAQLGYKAEYQNDHLWPQRIAPQDALPEALRGTRFYTPGNLGFERDITKRLEYFARIRAQLRGETVPPPQPQQQHPPEPSGPPAQPQPQQ